MTLGKLKEAIRRKRPQMWKDRKFLIHHDNASPHTADFTLRKMEQWGMKTLAHPPYSPDCAPCDFKLFPEMKKHLRGRRFPTVKALQAETSRILQRELDRSVFSDSIHEMVLRWQKCSAANGDYFEGDSVQVDPLFEHLDSSQETSESSDED